MAAKHWSKMKSKIHCTNKSDTPVTNRQLPHLLEQIPDVGCEASAVIFPIAYIYNYGKPLMPPVLKL
jgi:hypothetical protein